MVDDTVLYGWLLIAPQHCKGINYYIFWHEIPDFILKDTEKTSSTPLIQLQNELW